MFHKHFEELVGQFDGRSLFFPTALVLSLLSSRAAQLQLLYLITYYLPATGRTPYPLSKSYWRRRRASRRSNHLNSSIKARGTSEQLPVTSPPAIGRMTRSQTIGPRPTANSELYVHGCGATSHCQVIMCVRFHWHLKASTGTLSPTWFPIAEGGEATPNNNNTQQREDVCGVAAPRAL